MQFLVYMLKISWKISSTPLFNETEYPPQWVKGEGSKTRWFFGRKTWIIMKSKACDLISDCCQAYFFTLKRIPWFASMRRGYLISKNQFVLAIFLKGKTCRTTRILIPVIMFNIFARFVFFFFSSSSPQPQATTPRQWQNHEMFRKNILPFSFTIGNRLQLNL